MSPATWRAKALLAALVGSFLLAFAPISEAGTVDAPEITDPVADHAIVGTVPASNVGFAKADIQKVWLNETATHVNVMMLLGGAPAGNTQFDTRWTFTAVYAGKAITAGIRYTGGTAITGPILTGVADSSEASGTTLILHIPKTALGAVEPGTSLTSLWADSAHTGLGSTTGLITDRAPNSGFGTSYVFQAMAPSNQTVDDADQDGLNDTWEMQYFGNLTLENATGDPDSDGLNNTAEFLAGTDPSNPDTDGDDILDGDDEAPLDPNVPALTNTTDRDNDTLPDLWERQYFNNTAAQNATGDPDGDGLNNSAEWLLGTDPTKADTDGDGVNDMEDYAPLDALVTVAPKATSDTFAKPELYAGAGLFAAAATFCLLGLARFL